MPDREHVIEITEPIEIKIVGDRIHFTCVSGSRRQPYSIRFHEARKACNKTIKMLDREDTRSRESVTPMRKPKAGGGTHG